MEPDYNLPTGELPQDALPPLPKNTDCDSDWTPLKKALETYTSITLNHMRLWIHNSDDDELEEYWHASKYNVGQGDLLDKNKILVKSPLNPGMSEDQIQNVIVFTQKYLGFDPPQEYLDLLRITNGVHAAGTYDKDTTSRIQGEPFSIWQHVEYEVLDLLTRQWVDGEILPVIRPLDKRFGWKDDDLEVICGFKCGMLSNTFGGCTSGVWYFLTKPKKTTDTTESEVSGLQWHLVGTYVDGDPPSPFANIEAVLRRWANMYRDWAEIDEFVEPEEIGN